MKIIEYAKKFITNPSIRFGYISSLGLLNWISDKLYLQLQYRARFGKELNLDEPITFNEKMQWLKLYNRKPIYHILVDKYEVRDFVKNVIGQEYLIPSLGMWESPDEIDFGLLPNQFVLKCTHNSGLGMFICKDKTKMDKDKVIKELKRGIQQDYYLTSREWAYKDVPRRIVAEEYISDGTNIELRDYKVFVFNGIAKYIQVDLDRFSNHHRNFYDTSWNYIPFTTCYPTSPETVVSRPANLGKLIELSEKLTEAAGTPPFLRVDMYVINDRIYFGELTFYHGAGNERFYPENYNMILGEMIHLVTD